MRRRWRRRGTIPWRCRMSQAVDRPGNGQRGWRLWSQQLRAAPRRMPAPRLEDGRDDLLRRLMGRAPRAPRLLLQARGPMPQAAVDPLVAGFAADAIQRAQLRDRQRVAQEV